MSDILPRPWLWIFFVGYIFLTSFLILSLMTGVVSDFIVKQNEDYRRGDSYEADVKFFHKEMKKLFVGQTSKHHHKVEETAGGGFFHCCLHSEHVHEEHQDVPGHIRMVYFIDMWKSNKDTFDQFDICIYDEDDARDVFHMLDTENTGSLDWHQFKNGLQHMRGDATAKDILKVRRQIVRLSRELALARGRAPQDHHFVTSVRQKMDEVTHLVDDVGSKVNKLTGWWNDFTFYMDHRHQQWGGSPRTPRCQPDGVAFIDTPRC